MVKRRDDEGSLNERQGGFGDTLQSQSASEFVCGYCSTFVRCKVTHTRRGPRKERREGPPPWVSQVRLA